MSNLCFAAVSLPYLSRLFREKVPQVLIELISKYNGRKSLHALKQMMLHYSPSPLLQGLGEGKEYLALKTVDDAYNGCVFDFFDHATIVDHHPVILQVRTMVETARLSDRDFHLAQAAVLPYNWTDAPRFWESLSVEMMCFFFFFGGLGGQIMRILDILEEAPPRKKHTLTMFALLGFLNFQDCSVELPKVKFSVVERLAEFLHGEEELKKWISVLRGCTLASFPKAEPEESPEDEPSAKRARLA